MASRLPGLMDTVLYRLRKRRRAREAVPNVLKMSSVTISAAAANGTSVGQVFVYNPTGAFTYSLTDSAGGLFAIVGNSINKNAALTAGGRHVITVQTAGAAVLTRSFLVRVVA